MSPSDRPRLTQEQLNQYFNYIELPESTLTLFKSPDPSTQLKALTTLIRHQLCHIPFENLDLHYAPVRGISLNIPHLFHKVVERQAGRGGYCMQNNGLFATVLRTLGYNVVTAGARVASTYGDSNSGKQHPDDVSYGGFTHQVNFVTIGETKYFVDVGFGAAGPTLPVPLTDGFSAIQLGTTENVATSLRLTKGLTGNNSSRTPEQMVWRYTVKYAAADDTSKDWLPVYCFMETEFMPCDFEISSSFVSTKSVLFVNSILFCKFIMGVGEGEDGEREALVGDLTMINGVIKERKFGVSRVLRECKSEGERVSGLRDFLGVKLSEAEVEGIRGHITEIK